MEFSSDSALSSDQPFLARWMRMARVSRLTTFGCTNGSGSSRRQRSGSPFSFLKSTNAIAALAKPSASRGASNRFTWPPSVFGA